MKCIKKGDINDKCWRNTNCESNVCISGGYPVGEKTSGAVGRCKECWKNECGKGKTCDNLEMS